MGGILKPFNIALDEAECSHRNFEELARIYRLLLSSIDEGVGLEVLDKLQLVLLRQGRLGQVKRGEQLDRDLDYLIGDRGNQTVTAPPASLLVKLDRADNVWEQRPLSVV